MEDRRRRVYWRRLYQNTGLDEEGFFVKKNTVTTVTLIPTGTPWENDVFRIIARITLPADYKLIK
jgi:hypothetical protein